MFDQREVHVELPRRRALNAGVLIDATAEAAEAGVKYPVALTRTAWEAAVVVLPDLAGRSEAARLWDVVQALAAALRRHPGCDRVLCTILIREGPQRAHPVHLEAVCTQGDDRQPCLTLLLPGDNGAEWNS